MAEYLRAEADPDWVLSLENSSGLGKLKRAVEYWR